MLRGGLQEHADVHAFFVDRSGAIIASTDPTRPIGATLEIDASMLALENGCSASRVVVHDAQYAIMGCTVSHGYREFKVSDGYRSDVIAVVIESFGAVRERPLRADHALALVDSGLDKAIGTEFATFFIGGDLLAISSSDVQEAMPMTKVSPISMGDWPGRIGVLPVDGGASFIWVFDLGFLLSGKLTAIDTSSQVVVVRHGARTIGLLVSELHGVARFDPARISPTPLVGSAGMLVEQVIQANDGKLLIQVIALDYLFGNLVRPAANDHAGLLAGRI
jgi:chemotaxis signal transduction protein